MVVTVGEAVTDEPDVVLNPVAGLHENVFAPVAESVVFSPLQITGFVLAMVIGGAGETIIFNEVVSAQPFISIPITV